MINSTMVVSCCKDDLCNTGKSKVDNEDNDSDTATGVNKDNVTEDENTGIKNENDSNSSSDNNFNNNGNSSSKMFCQDGFIYTLVLMDLILLAFYL